MALVGRDKYLNEVLRYRDTNLIKIITGVRRCGKTSLLALIELRLKKEGIDENNFVWANLESKVNTIENAADLYDFFSEKAQDGEHMYFFIDEVQRLYGWENAVNALRNDFDCDIFIAGSNAFLFSSELSTYLSGQYVEIKMLPLTFAEYLTFCGLTVDPHEDYASAFDSRGGAYNVDDLVERYLNFGGMPKLARLDITQSMHASYMESLHEALAIRDIITYERHPTETSVRNPFLVRELSELMADTVGEHSSLDGIMETLRVLGSDSERAVVRSYLKALKTAFIYYPAAGYDIEFKKMIAGNPKHYIADTGMLSSLQAYRFHNREKAIENVVYLQLLYSGYEARWGRVADGEIDFVGTKSGNRIFVQVTDACSQSDEWEQDMAALGKTVDGEKYMVVKQSGVQAETDGVHIVGLRRFLLDETLLP